MNRKEIAQAAEERGAPKDLLLLSSAAQLERVIFFFLVGRPENLHVLLDAGVFGK